MKKAKPVRVRSDFRLPADLKVLATKIAEREGTTLTELVIQGLRIQIEDFNRQEEILEKAS